MKILKTKPRLKYLPLWRKLIKNIILFIKKCECVEYFLKRRLFSFCQNWKIKRDAYSSIFSLIWREEIPEVEGNSASFWWIFSVLPVLIGKPKVVFEMPRRRDKKKNTMVSCLLLHHNNYLLFSDSIHTYLLLHNTPDLF